MIHCGRLTTGQIIKILGVFQLIGAIIITSVGISIVVDFISIHHVKEHNSEIADSYVDMHWTVTYGAVIWMGLIMALAGAFGIFADIKPHKSKYVYGTLVMNTLVIIAAILLVVFCYDAITWFDTCQYKYLKSISINEFIRDCTEEDKSKGKVMYWVVFVVTIIMILLTFTMLALIVFANKVLFEDGICNTCMQLGAPSSNSASNNNNSFFKKRHHFDKEIAGTTIIPVTTTPSEEVLDKTNYTKASVYC